MKVSTPTVIPSERAARAAKEPARVAVVPSIEIKLVNGHTLIVRGEVEVTHLAHVIDVLVRR